MTEGHEPHMLEIAQAAHDAEEVRLMQEGTKARGKPEFVQSPTFAIPMSDQGQPPSEGTGIGPDETAHDIGAAYDFDEKWIRNWGYWRSVQQYKT